jgi:hypothetical protein
VLSIRDLGITLDSKLSFNEHIDNIVARAYKKLGMVLRLSKPFKNAFTLKVLYYSFVRSILEFGSVVWSPHFDIHKSRLERIQKIFCKSLDYRAGYYNLDYFSSAARHNLSPLEKRRAYLDVLFLFKVIRNQIDSNELLGNISFKISRLLSRSKPTFSISSCRTKYAKNSFFRRTCNVYNESLNEIDVFAHDLPVFKNKVRQMLFSRP